MPCVMWVFSKNAVAIALGRDQLVELLDLVAELDRQRVGLKFAGVADGFHVVLACLSGGRRDGESRFRFLRSIANS